ncbi:response regulator aspartate phosphatase [Shouchella tritolerans]|uniref:response regulator aspartate phosphatase n=1 Tax=Shouchella tritolerans TaxID=2979466 RepID=UPI0021E85BC3|nr:tetratricopeptide repeat protein [Shouchella tritolerans]
MGRTISSESVGAKIAEWYSCLLSKSYEQAILLKEEVKQLLPAMDPSDKFMAFYSLVEFKHQILVSRYDKNECPEKIEPISEKTEIDDLLTYLYYFVNGQYEFTQERYQSAVKLFRKAERLLEYVNDEAEEAEFYQYIGLVYYRLNHYLIASSYMEQANVLFDRLQYHEPAINCQIITACIHQELNNPEKGEAILKQALECAKGIPIVYGQVLRTLGLNKQGQKKFDEAETYFKRALDIPEHKNTIFGAKSRYNLSNVLFNQGKIEEALPHFQIAKAGAAYYKSKEYNARCLFTEGLHIEKNYDLVDEAIAQLQKEGMDFEVSELAEEAAHFAEKEGNTRLALKYMKVAHGARLYQHTLGVDSVV